ncbi:MAG: APC family permease [Acutalibacteraceae bacterium]
MSNKLHKRYGLPTAICMVVGIVIGSGVFFKAEKILTETGGNLPLGILAWVIGGLVMISCALAFSFLATKHEKVNGLVDYAEAVVGKRYAFMIGWFMAIFYYPTLTSVLAWISARYICVLMGWSIAGGQCLALAGFLLCASFAMNTLAPVLSGKFQVSTTIIKMIPLLLMAVVGTIKGLSDGMLVQNFTTVVREDINTMGALFKAVVATCFAYEGWIIATTINAELKDAKRNLPRALVAGTITVVLTYIVYYIGLAGGITNEEMMAGGEAGAKMAFSAVFSNFAGTLLFVFVVISCIGTLNGLMLGNVRGLYSCAMHSDIPSLRFFRPVDPESNMPANSGIFSLLIASAWLLYFYGAVITTIEGHAPWFGKFSYDSSELPIVTTYAMYIPIFISMIRKEKDLGLLKGKIVPALAIVTSAFMVIAAIFAHGVYPYMEAKAEGRFEMPVLFYLIMYAVIMGIGAAILFSGEKKVRKKK